MDTIEPVPEAALWEGFDRICTDAEAKRDLTVQAARAERDWAMQPVQPWKAFRRVQAMAHARFEAKVKAANELCELTCQTAEDALNKALDESGSRDGGVLPSTLERTLPHP